jgi:hypothetical protein
MEYRFKAEEWDTLTSEQRARRCRLLASEAIKLADHAPARVAEAYLSLAGAWLKLANEIESGGSQ